MGGALWLGQLPNGIVLRIASSAVRSASPVLVDLARNLVDGLGSRYVKACRHLASSRTQRVLYLGRAERILEDECSSERSTSVEVSSYARTREQELKLEPGCLTGAFDSTFADV